MRAKWMPSADLTFRSFARLTVRFTAVLVEKSDVGKNNLVDNLAVISIARAENATHLHRVTTLTAQIAKSKRGLLRKKRARTWVAF